MNIFSKESLGDLEKGIKQLLLEDRCSFSVDDRALLNECLALIDNVKSDLGSSLRTSTGFLVKITELVTKIVLAGEHLKDLF